ncbi:MAG: beta-hydroxyacyl-ACP dehydratase [Clostridiales bacterium]|nr:beta-hydroxyacyl-ACP dehydratase [Clostridiales bacterium]
MTREEIKTILPHRDAMLLLDELYREDDTAHGVKYINGDEWFLQGHFPDSPIVPGVILCEILAQSACVLLTEGVGEGKIPMYTGLDKVRFKSPVLPGDKFETKCRITRARPPFYFAEGQGFVGDRLCVRAEFSFAVTERKA